MAGMDPPYSVSDWLTMWSKPAPVQIRILEWFLKDHVTGVMMLKSQLWKTTLIVPNKLFNCTRKWIKLFCVIAKYILNKLQTKNI